MTVPSRLLSLVVAVAALLSVSGCGGAVHAQGFPEIAETAALRLVHLSPDAPRIDLQVNERATIRDLAFGRSSDYASVPAGRHTMRVFPHRLPDAETEGGESAEGTEGAESADEQLPRLEPITLVVTLEPGAYYTLALVGFYEPPPDAQNGSLSVEVAPDEARVVVRGPRGYELSTVGDLLEGGLEPGEYTVDVSAPGYRSARSQVQVESLQTQVVSVTLQEGEREDDSEPELEGDAVTGSATGWNPVELQLFRDLAQGVPPANHAFARVIHAAPITVPVDVLWVEPGEDATVRSVTVVDDLAFPNDSDYVAVPPGASTLELHIAGRREAVVRLTDYGLAPGSVVTLFVVSDLGDSAPSVVPLVEALVLTTPPPP